MFLKTDLKSGGQDGAFGAKRKVLAQKLKELAFTFVFTIVLTNPDLGTAIQKSDPTSGPTSKNFSGACSEFRRSRRSFWNQKEVSSSKIEQVDIFLLKFIFF